MKNGYGRNFLIPQGAAILATSSARKVLAENLKQRAYKEQKQVDEAKAIATKLAGLEIKLSVKAGSGDKIFGSISNTDLAEAFAKEGVSIEKKFITIPGGTIKRLGSYEATVRLHRSVVTTKAFDIVAEKKA